MTRRAALLPLLLLPFLAWWGSSPAQAQRVAPVEQRSVVEAIGSPEVVVVGVPGLRWSDVNDRDTPALARMQGEGASGVLSVKTAAKVDCPAAGWLTLGAGNRVAPAGRYPGDGDPYASTRRCGVGVPASSTLAEQVRENDDRREGAVPGLLGSTLRAAGLCVQGVGPGGELAAADRAGLSGPSAATGSCPVVLREATPARPALSRTSRAAGVAAADALVATELDRRTPNTTVLVVGVSEAPGESVPHLHVALAVGPTFAPGALTSASTRRAPYVQLVDVAPTILSLLDLDTPKQMIGEPWRSEIPRPTLDDLRDEAVKADAHRTSTVPFFVLLAGVQVLLIGVALWRRWRRTAEVAALAGVTAVGASYLANLVPWWRAEQPLVLLLAATAVATAALTGVALLGRGLLARAGIACGMVAAVLVGDLLLGGQLQMSSVAGYSPLVAGRFAGIGNVAFGVLAAAVLLAAASTRSATAAALTALVVVVDGAPQWGSDVGGVLALVPAYAVLVLLLRGRAASLAKVAIASAVGVAVVTAFAVADYSRAAQEQTHLGRFVGQVLDGSAGGVLRRKAEANLGLLFLSPVTALLPVLVIVLLVLFLRPPAPLRRVFEQEPAWRAGLLAVITASAIGFLLNDSGAAVPALAILIALPATVAVLARHARRSAAAG